MGVQGVEPGSGLWGVWCGGQGHTDRGLACRAGVQHMGLEARAWSEGLARGVEHMVRGLAHGVGSGQGSGTDLLMMR